MPERHWLTYRREHLAAVRSGTKTATIRFSQQAARVRRGDRLVLAFGRYDAPELLEAVAVRVAHVDLTADLKRLHADLARLEESGEDEAAAAAEDALVATLTPAEVRQLWLEEGVSADLLDALEDAGGSYDDVLFEADDRGQPRVSCVWWQLT